jgi:hypothetical protein
MNNVHRLLGVFVASLLLVPAAGADWMDDFDSYAVGSGLNGQGGWECWDDDPAFDAYVSDAYALSSPHSAQIVPTSDLVHQFVDYFTGQWVVTAWLYVPDGFVGESYFLLLNTYNHGGPYNWSCQVVFNSDGYVESYPELDTLPLIVGEWVELRVEINLTTDVQTFYYGGDMLYQKSWVDGVSGGGVPNIGCIDLFGNNADPVYYDDCSIMEPGTATEVTTWGNIKATFR